ncbi:hypothetical protein EGW08_008305, partial [Elysia chlorotica]
MRLLLHRKRADFYFDSSSADPLLQTGSAISLQPLARPQTTTSARDKMATKQSNEELRREIRDEDRKKDVNLYAAVAIAVFSGISSASGVLATLSIAFLEGFRKDVELFWLACTPFIFPVVTGVSIAYRKQLASVGMHIALVLLTSSVGGAGYGLTVEYVHFESHNCTSVSADVGDCDREVLVYIYVISGLIASVCAGLGLLLSLCACKSAMKRRARRVQEQEIRLHQEDDRRAREVKRSAHSARPALSTISPAKSPAPPTPPTVHKPTPLTPSTPSVGVTQSVAPTAPLSVAPAAKPATSFTATATQTGPGGISDNVNAITSTKGM